jgi:hypothetical protein
MLITIFFLLLLLSGVGVIYGFYKSHISIYLLGAGIITILGILVIGEGLALDSQSTLVDSVSGEVFTKIPEIMLTTNSQTAYLLGYGCLYGGMFLVGLGTIVIIMWFAKNYRGE